MYSNQAHDTRSPASDKNRAPDGGSEKKWTGVGSARTAGPAKPEKWTGEGVATANDGD